MHIVTVTNTLALIKADRARSFFVFAPIGGSPNHYRHSVRGAGGGHRPTRAVLRAFSCASAPGCGTTTCSWRKRGVVVYVTWLPELHVASDSQRGRGEVEMMQPALKATLDMSGNAHTTKRWKFFRTLSGD